MAAFADSFKAEVARIARKEGKDDVAFLRRASATQRGEIAALKKEVKALSTQLKALAKALARAPGAEAASKPVVARRGGRNFVFDPSGLSAKREGFGLSITEMAQLLAVSPLTLRRWEAGAAKPRAAQVERIRDVLTLGVRAARKRLAESGE